MVVEPLGPDMGTTPVDDDHREHLAKSQRRWEFWSSRWTLAARDTEGIRRTAIDALGLERGDAVLDVGCGPGVNFGMLHDAVGPEGSILGVDLTPGMLAKARERVADEGWDNVDLVRADATRTGFDPETFDGAVATTAVSATPDVRAVVGNVHDALVPGGRFGLHDIRRVPSGPARALNPLVVRFYRLFGGAWNDEEDVLAELRRRFDGVELLETEALGTNYAAVAEKGD